MNDTHAVRIDTAVTMSICLSHLHFQTRPCSPKVRQTTASMASDFGPVFVRLRGILERTRGNLSVTDDTPAHYCLTGGCHPTHKVPMPVAWVEIKKAYVSFHHMGVYCAPKLLEDVSEKLKARMQGKSCFNFKTLDEPLFEELEELTIRAFAILKRNLAALNAKSASAGIPTRPRA